MNKFTHNINLSKITAYLQFTQHKLTKYIEAIYNLHNIYDAKYKFSLPAGVFKLNDNHFIELFSPAVMQQKIDYIHQNPVRAALVYRAEDCIYSSASNYACIDGNVDVDCLF